MTDTSFPTDPIPCASTFSTTNSHDDELDAHQLHPHNRGQRPQQQQHRRFEWLAPFLLLALVNFLAMTATLFGDGHLVRRIDGPRGGRMSSSSASMLHLMEELSSPKTTTIRKRKKNDKTSTTRTRTSSISTVARDDDSATTLHPPSLSPSHNLKSNLRPFTSTSITSTTSTKQHDKNKNMARNDLIETTFEENHDETGNLNDNLPSLSTTTIDNHGRTVSYLDFSDLRDLSEAYAGAWYMTTHRFLTTYQTKDLVNNEAVVFRALRHAKRDLRMTVDWLDFGVEHLSKYWKRASFERFATTHERLLRNLFHQVISSTASTISATATSESDHWHNNRNPMRQTLSVVAYSPMKPPSSTTLLPHQRTHPERYRQLDIAVLAAQLASLVHANCGRIVLVFHDRNLDYVSTHIWPAILQLLNLAGTDSSSLSSEPKLWESWWKSLILERPQQAQSATGSNRTTPIFLLNATIGSSEIALVPIETDTPQNIPISSIRMLRRAFVTTNNRDNPDDKHDEHKQKQHNLDMFLQQAYFGPQEKEAWKYLYYTESDSPLVTRANALPHFQTILDAGKVLLPHRWQPVQHETDLAAPTANMSQGNNSNVNVDDGNDKLVLPLSSSTFDVPSNYYLPALFNWTTVQSLSKDDDYSCCDGGKDYYPAKDDFHGSNETQRGNFWYLGGFGGRAIDLKNSTADYQHRFVRMLGHVTVRIPHGTRLTLFAASEHARTCIPTKEPCSGEARQTTMS